MKTPEKSRKNTRVNPPRSARVLSHSLEPLESRQLLTADLIGTFTSVPARINLGTTAAVTLRIQNTGNTSTAVPFGVDIFALADSGLIGGAASVGLTHVNVKAIGAGGAQNVKIQVPVNANIAAGSFRLEAVLDTSHVVGESNENNNIVQSNVVAFVQPSFDLTPTSAVASSIPARIAAGSAASGTVNVRITNPSSSNAATPKGQSVIVQVVARPIGAADASGDIVLNRSAGSVAVGNLAPGKSVNASVSVRLPATLAVGAYSLVVKVDATNQLAESNEANNDLTLGTQVVVSNAINNASGGSAGSAGSSVGGSAISGVTLTPMPVNTNLLNLGSIAPTVNPFNLTSTTGLTPFSATGNTPFNSTDLNNMQLTTGLGLTPTGDLGTTPTGSAGLTPVDGTGTTPTNLLGQTPTTGIGSPPTTSLGQTPTTFGETLSPFGGGFFITM